MRTALVLLVSILGAAAAHAEPAPMHVGYDKGTVLGTDDGAFELKLNLKNQFRLESTRPTEDGAEASSRLYIPRSRLGFAGHVFGDATRFKLEVALGDRGSFGFVRDAYVEHALHAQDVWVRVGQWKRPFNRQELVADFSSEFNERANTAAFAGGGRDVGIAVQNQLEKSPDGIEWSVGVFNAFSGGADRPRLSTTCTEDAAMTIGCTTGAPTTVPGDFGPAVVARVGWNHGGIKGYSEVDLEGGPLRVAVGASYKVDLADLDGDLSHGLEGDAMLKVEGFDAELGVYMMKLATAHARYGAFVQAGYMVVPKKVQVAARFARAPTTSRREQLEARVAASWFWQGHGFKWVNDAGMVKETGEDPVTMTADDPDLQVRSMVQLVF